MLWKCRPISEEGLSHVPKHLKESWHKEVSNFERWQQEVHSYDFDTPEKVKEICSQASDGKYSIMLFMPNPKNKLYGISPFKHGTIIIQDNKVVSLELNRRIKRRWFWKGEEPMQIPIEY